MCIFINISEVLGGSRLSGSKRESKGISGKIYHALVGDEDI